MARPSLASAALALILAGCSDIGDDLHVTSEAGLAAPTGLTAAALPGGAQVRLSWADNSTEETAFRIDVNTAPFGTTPTVVNVIEAPAGSTSYTYDTWPGRTLYFHVLAVTATLESDPSNVVSLTTPNVPPAPVGLQASAASASRIDLQWQDVAGETGYRIERSADSGASWSMIANLGANATTHIDLGLAPDTEYRYRAFAFNADGDSVPSNVASAVTQTVAMTIRTAASTGDVGRWASIGLVGGTEYISHYDATPTSTNCVLTYGSVSTTYLTSTIDPGPTGAESVGYNGTSLAIDASGYRHVAAYDWTNGDLRYVTNYPGPPYVATTADSAGSVGAFPRIAVSPINGTIHVIYTENLPGPDQLKHAVCTYGIWSFEAILPSPQYLASYALTFDASGNLHVSYSGSSDGGTYELVHARKSGTAWTLTTATNAGQPLDNSIAIDPSGFPHIAYFSGGTANRLMHATNAGGSWASEVVHEATGGDLGRYNSVAIHPTSGRIHVAYYDGGARDLRYARKDPGGGWVLRLLDSAGDVGSYASIAVEASGAVHITYRDETNQDLKVALGAP